MGFLEDSNTTDQFDRSEVVIGDKDDRTKKASVDGNGRVQTSDVLVLSFITAEKTSTSTRSIARVGAANLVGRKAIEIVNTSTVVLYVGSSTVTTSGATRGRPIDPKSSFAVDLADNVDLYIISASNATYVVTEVG